jgi:hypothetical protein
MMNGEALKGFALLGAALLLIGLNTPLYHPIYLLVTAVAVIDAAIGRSRRTPGSYRARDWA